MMQSMMITTPDDFHLHLRDESVLSYVLPHTVHEFARAIIMPNLQFPVRTLADAQAYRTLILAASS